MSEDVVGISGREDQEEEDMPVLSCEIEEVDSDSEHPKGTEPNSGNGIAGEDEVPASWPIFENISNGYFLENMDTTSEGGQADQDEGEGDAVDVGDLPPPGDGSDPLAHPLVIAHDRRIFNSRKLTNEEKNKLALEGNPGFRYRKLYSNGQKSYKCWLCPTACNVFDKLVRHERRHGLESKYPCTYCDYGALAPKLLDQHISYHKLQTNPGPEQMRNCYLKTSSSTSRTNPYKTRPRRKITKTRKAIPIVPYVKVEEMEQDESGINPDEEAVKLALKGNPNFVYARLPSRENPSRSNYNFHCWICPSVFDRMDNLLRHNKLHGANKRHQCEECNISYDFPSLLDSHKVKHQMQRDESIGKIKPEVLMQKPRVSISGIPGMSHEGSKLQAALENDSVHAIRKKLITCPKCPARFYMNKDRTLHMRLHGAGNEFMCRFCDYSSKQDFLLARHEELHTKRIHSYNPNSTPIPGHVSATASRTPSSDQRKVAMKCTKCPAVIFSQRDFESHMGLHGSDKKFRCRVCDYAVSRVDYLRKHELIHQPSRQKAISRGLSLGASRVSSPIYNRSLKRNSDMLPKVARNSLAAKTISTAEYHRIRAGNPEFYYKPCIRISHGRRQECTTFKCLLCPSAYLEFKHYLDHVQLHGGNNEFNCTICDYSVNGEQRYYKHMEFHELNDQHRPRQKQATARTIASNSRQQPVSQAVRAMALPIKHKIKTEMGVEDDTMPLEVELEPSIKRMRPSRDYTRERKEMAATQMKDEPSSSQVGMQQAHALMSPTKPQRRIKTIAEAYIVDTDISMDAKSNNEFLIQHVTVRNFMCIEEFDAPVRTNVLAFQGNMEGKSASIIALLIGLGYDVLLENYTPTSLCGVNLKDLVRRGYDTCTIELTLSLHSSNDLEEQYGSHLKLVRTLHKGLPLSSCSFEICSADMNDLYPRNSVVIGKPRLRSILEKLNITPLYFRLLLLDNVNINHVMSDTDNWYTYYDNIVISNVKSVQTRLDKLMLKFNRLKDDLQWRNSRYTFLMNQLNTEYPIEDQTFREWRKADVQDHSQMEKELGELYERHIEMEGIIGCYTNEINDLSKVLLGRMKHRYQEFLHRQSFTGSVLLDEEGKGLAVWIMDMNCTEKPPYTVEEALTMWATVPHKTKFVAVIGLFLAYWEITNNLPLFALDASSSSENTFKFPKGGLPVLLEVIEKKCRDGHQFIASLPSAVPSTPAPPEDGW